MAEWLFEIFSEEIPSRMQLAAQKQLKELTAQSLKKARLQSGLISTFATPRRLTVLVEGLETCQTDQKEEKRGPRVDAPQAAIDGFLKTSGLTLDQCEERDTPKGKFFFATQHIKGQPTEDLLPDIALNILKAFHWPKSMVWADHKETWVRPLRGLLCIYESKVIPLTYAGVDSSNVTWGHRFMSEGVIEVYNFVGYRDKLAQANVVLDWHERRHLIKAEVDLLAETVGCVPTDDPSLLDEVTGLVEYPVPLLGHVDEQFMVLPDAVITTPMRVHQRYFPLRDKSTGKLAPYFVVIANTKTKDDGKTVVIGNERVLRARLADARFFWEQDQLKPLASYNEALEKLMFHQKLGSTAQKVHRIEKLAVWLGVVTEIPAKELMEAAQLCKADLATQMVGEFPELQGVIGRAYALNQGVDENIAAAIEEHYWPLGAGGKTPESMTSILLGLADRIDTLVGFFALGIRPTGSKDPFALRRAALGVLSLVSASSKPIALKDAFSFAYNLYDWDAIGKETVLEKDNTVNELWHFLLDRFKHFLRDQQQSPYDHVDAVLAIAERAPDFKTLSRRVSALDQFLGTDNGMNLLAAYKRASSILRIEERNDSILYKGEVREELLNSPAELSLFEELELRDSSLKGAVNNENFDEVMSILSELRPSVDTFFDLVVVNVDDPSVRQNRLELLSKIRNTLHQVADFSKIEG